MLPTSEHKLFVCFSFTYKVTDEELKAANQTFNGLSDIVLRALPDAPLQPLLARLGRSGNCLVSAKTWLRGTDPALRDVIAKEALQYKKSHVSQVKTLGYLFNYLKKCIQTVFVITIY